MINKHKNQSVEIEFWDIESEDMIELEESDIPGVYFNEFREYVDEKGNKVIATGFDDACDFNEQGKTFVKTDDKWQVLTLYLYNHES